MLHIGIADDMMKKELHNIIIRNGIKTGPLGKTIKIGRDCNSDIVEVFTVWKYSLSRDVIS